MWKIFFTYPDKSKITLTGKGKDIPLSLAIKYYNLYGLNAESIYQQYPKKCHEPISLIDKIELLQEESGGMIWTEKWSTAVS